MKKLINKTKLLSKAFTFAFALVAGLGFGVMPASATSTVPNPNVPSVRFKWPLYASTSSAKNITISFDMMANSSLWTGKELHVSLLASNNGEYNTDPTTSKKYSDLVTVTFTDTTTPKSISFSNLELTYKPYNYFFILVKAGNTTDEYSVAVDKENNYAKLKVIYDPNYVNYSSKVALHRFWSEDKDGHFFTTSEAEKNHIIANDTSWDYEGPAFNVGALNKDESCKNSDQKQVYRFYNPTAMHHFYTINKAEKDHLVKNSTEWDYEGVAFCANTTSMAQSTDPQEMLKPVFRFYSDIRKAHFFTINEAEKDAIIANDQTWSYENIAYYAYPMK